MKNILFKTIQTTLLMILLACFIACTENPLDDTLSLSQLKDIKVSLSTDSENFSISFTPNTNVVFYSATITSTTDSSKTISPTSTTIPMIVPIPTTFEDGDYTLIVRPHLSDSEFGIYSDVVTFTLDRKLAGLKKLTAVTLRSDSNNFTISFTKNTDISFYTTTITSTTDSTKTISPTSNTVPIIISIPSDFEDGSYTFRVRPHLSESEFGEFSDSQTFTLDRSVVSQKLNDARTFMEDGDTLKGLESYESILVNNPDHTESNIMVALMSLVDILVDDTTKTVIENINQKMGGEKLELPESRSDLFDSTSLGATAATIIPLAVTQIATDTTFNVIISNLYTEIDNVIIPALNSSIERLKKVLNQNDFTITLTEDMTGADENYELDKGEVYTIHALFSLIQGILYQVTAYDFQTNYDFQTLLENNEYDFHFYKLLDSTPSFGTLRNTTAMSNALTHLQNAVQSSIDGLSYINNETDSQADDIFQKDYLPENLDETLEDLNEIKSYLGGTVYTEKITNPKTGDTIDLEININKIFTNPIADIRDYAGISADGNLEATDFPSGFDFTINGLFPNMTSFDKWNQFNYYDYILYFPTQNDNVFTSQEYYYSLDFSRIYSQDNSIIVLYTEKNSTKIDVLNKTNLNKTETKAVVSSPIENVQHFLVSNSTYLYITYKKDDKTRLKILNITNPENIIETTDFQNDKLSKLSYFTDSTTFYDLGTIETEGEDGEKEDNNAIIKYQLNLSNNTISTLASTIVKDLNMDTTWLVIENNMAYVPEKSSWGNSYEIGMIDISSDSVSSYQKLSIYTNTSSTLPRISTNEKKLYIKDNTRSYRNLYVYDISNINSPQKIKTFENVHSFLINDKDLYISKEGDILKYKISDINNDPNKKYSIPFDGFYGTTDLLFNNNRLFISGESRVVSMKIE